MPKPPVLCGPHCEHRGAAPGGGGRGRGGWVDLNQLIDKNKSEGG